MYVETVVLIVFIVGILICGYCFERSEGKKNGEKKARRKKEEKEEAVQRRRCITAHDVFDVDVDPPYESQAYDEIVRIVNLDALLIANACVAQDKFARSERHEIDHSTDLDDEVRNRKSNWSFKRSCALKICPELADRLPHFSEVEPLKSYRAEHIQEKTKRKSAA